MPDTDTSDKPAADKVSRTALVMMIVILIVMSLVALHLNWVRWHRDQIEKVIVTPIPTATPNP